VKPFNIAGVSFMPELWKPKKNLKRLLGTIDEAVEKGADVIASCEGALDGYITKDLAKNRIAPADKGTTGYRGRLAKFRKRQLALARTIRDDCIGALRDKAREHAVWLFANTLDLRGKARVYNTTFVINPTGKIVGKYDKIHAAFEVVNALGRRHRVFETPFAPIGVLICADRQHPEAPRATALLGAQVLIINSYGMWGEGANERFIRQRAYENGVYLLFCHPNETVLVSPEGKIIGGTCAWENVLVRTIDPREAVGRGVFGTAGMAKTYEICGQPSAYARKHRQKKRRTGK